MEPRSFVRVLTTIDKADYRGTGYRVCRNRVLTARHLVAGAAKIVVELDDESGRRRRVEARDLPLGDHDLDVALLDLTTDDPVPEADLAHGPLARPTTWHSRGCPGAAISGDCVADSMEPFGGKAFPSAEHEQRFKLQADNWSQDVTDWQGVSGAPVFVDDRIYGVVSRAPKSFRGQRLWAVPMHLVLRVDGFPEALGLAEDDGKWKKPLAEIRKLLKDDAIAAAAVAEALGSWDGEYRPEQAENLATALERSPVLDALKAINAAHHQLVEDGQVRSTQVAESVAAVIVPFLHQWRMTIVAEPGSALLRVPVATNTVAELVMAGLGVREYRYREVSRREFPEPLALVPGFPESGIDAEDKRAFGEFVEHLAKEFTSEKDREIVGRGMIDEKRYEKLAALVDGELEWRAEAPGDLRPYFVFDSSFAERYRLFLGRVKQSLPSLLLVELTGSDLLEDRRLCRPLRDLLYRSHNWRSSE